MSRPRRSPVQKYYDRVADRYDHSYDDSYWRWHDSLTWDYIKPYLPSDQSVPVLDLGCGTGKWGSKLIKSGFNVTFVDISARMLDQARAKIAEKGGESKANYLKADLGDLSELPDGAFGLAVAMGDPIGCTESPIGAMKEIRRVLTVGGVLTATVDNQLAAIDFYLETAVPGELEEFLKTGKTHWLTKAKDEQFPIFTFTADRLCKLATRAGFEVVDLIGKTVLPMRHHRELLSDSRQRLRWTRIEQSLCRKPDAISRASHLHITCRAVAQ
ncbi:MAG: class I SAM-dependent methyltransferase [Planctomycetes bacterium]|nr:class I SAM-dependent methyltransferase [Planctomycetota bacterium]